MLCGGHESTNGMLCTQCNNTPEGGGLERFAPWGAQIGWFIVHTMRRPRGRYGFSLCIELQKMLVFAFFFCGFSRFGQPAKGGIL